MLDWLRRLFRIQRTHPTPSSGRGLPARRARLVAPATENRPEPQPREPDPLAATVVDELFYEYLLKRPESGPDALSPEESRWLSLRRGELQQPAGRLTHLVPRLPAVLPKLMAALSDNNTPVHHLTEMIEADPVIAANVLKLVNSPALRVRREDIHSLDQAVMLLGYKGMREVVAAATFSPIARLETQSGINPLLAREIWPLSLRAAAAIRQSLASSDKRFDAIDGALGFEIYLAALTRLTGLVALLRLRQDLPSPPSAAFCRQLSILVPSFSAHLARTWALSDHTVSLIGRNTNARGIPPVAHRLLEEALSFSTACALTNRRYLDRSQLLHFCRAQATHASGWFDLCPPPPAHPHEPH